MHISEFIETIEVAKTFIESLGGEGLHDAFVPGPTSVEIGYSNDHPQVSLDYHLSGLHDVDRAAVVGALSRLEHFHWGTATNPFGVTWVTAEHLRIKIQIEVYVPGTENRGPMLREALLAAGWRTAAGVG